MAFRTIAKTVHVQPDAQLHVLVSSPTSSPPQESLPKPTLVLLHFWGGSCSTWAHVHSLLAPRHPVVALDFRGWGQSIGPDDALAYSVTQLADDVECVIRTLQLRPFILVGHSMGAKVSQVVAGRKAIEGLLGLVLVSPAPPSPLTLPPEMREEQRHAYDNPESAEFVTRNVLTASPLQQAVVDHIVADMIKGNEYAKSAWPAYGMNSNIVSDAMRIDVPTLVVGASKDIVEPIARIQTELCTVIRHAELDIVDGSGHLIPIEAPDKLALIILRFVQGLDNK